MRPQFVSTLHLYLACHSRFARLVAKARSTMVLCWVVSLTAKDAFDRLRTRLSHLILWFQSRLSSSIESSFCSAFHVLEESCHGVKLPL